MRKSYIFSIISLKNLMSFLTNLEWRYAAKRFDTTKKVSDADFETILKAIRLTPTSTNVQPYHFYIIQNPELREQIKAAAWNQEQITTSSHLLVFAARTDIEQNKEEVMQSASGQNPAIREQLKGYEWMLDGLISQLRAHDMVASWAARQTYIALGFAMAAAAELEIDSCPMEWFNTDTVAKIIGTKDTEQVLAMLPIGYRVDGEGPRTTEKVRFTNEELFTTIA